VALLFREVSAEERYGSSYRWTGDRPNGGGDPPVTDDDDPYESGRWRTERGVPHTARSEVQSGRRRSFPRSVHRTPGVILLSSDTSTT
jgi:hypothetical protein